MSLAGFPCPRCAGQMLFYIGIEVPTLNCVQCGEVRYLKRAPTRAYRRREDSLAYAEAPARLSESA